MDELLLVNWNSTAAAKVVAHAIQDSLVSGELCSNGAGGSVTLQVPLPAHCASQVQTTA